MADKEASTEDASSPIVLQKMEVIDLPAVADLEQRSYPDDEAADRKVLDYRVNYASHLCYVAFHQEEQQVMGFVVATGAPDDTQHMTSDMMRNHYQGNVLCIHSVVIANGYRRKGFGTFMLKSYLNKIRQYTSMKRILLLSKQYLLPFYKAVGFQEIGLSNVAHGKEPWVEMTATL